MLNVTGLPTKKYLKYTIKITISVILFYLIIKDVDFIVIIDSIKSAEWSILTIAFLLHFLGFYLSSLRWKILLKTQGLEPKISFLIKSCLVAMFFNQFLPSTVGGDTIRAYDSYRLGKNKADAISVIFIDRFLGLLILLLFASMAVLYLTELTLKISFIYLWIIGAIALTILTILLIFFPSKKFLNWLDSIKVPMINKVSKIIRSIVNSFLQFKKHKKALFKALVISLLLQTNVIIYYFLISNSLVFGIELSYFFLIIPLSIFIMMLPISINGIGLRENVFFLFLSNFAIGASEAVAFAWIEFFFLLILGLIGGLVYAFRH